MVSLARRRLVVQRTRAAELVLAGSTFFNAQRMTCTNGRREISPINAFARSRQRLRNRPCSSLSSFLCPPARKIMTCTYISPADVVSLYLLCYSPRRRDRESHAPDPACPRTKRPRGFCLRARAAVGAYEARARAPRRRTTRLPTAPTRPPCGDPGSGRYPWSSF